MKNVLLIALMALAIACTATAGTDHSGTITADETWFAADNPHHLVDDVIVDNDATLTIEAGVIVASFQEDNGSLGISRGCDLIIEGTKENPVIFTSADDCATWDGTSAVDTSGNGIIERSEFTGAAGDPKTGVWREGAAEWGSIAIMGNGIISASHYEVTDGDCGLQVRDNTTCPEDGNEKEMEGFVPVAGEDWFLYGGLDDNDDCGSISYLSLRYGGREPVLTNQELNGLSLGAVGRATDIDHIDIMNNRDDGIEIWGGTVQLSHVNIWNIGDDSFDVDEGWRGCAEYGLIVQGYSMNTADQGGAIGDNAFETDGAERQNVNPMTTAKISKFTVVGQPGGAGDNSFAKGSDAGTAWRDNARVQYDSCIWMDLDDHIVKYDENDGDGGWGYDGDCGTKSRTDNSDNTMSWVEHWTNTYSQWKNETTNWSADPYGCNTDMAALYEQWICIDMNTPLCAISNSVFYGDDIKYSEYDQLDTEMTAALGHGHVNNTIAGSMPIQGLTRGADVTIGAYLMKPVIDINPLPAAGVTAGGFQKCNWIAGWTAASAYGFTSEVIEEGNTDINCDGITNGADLAMLGSGWLN